MNHTVLRKKSVVFFYVKNLRCDGGDIPSQGSPGSSNVRYEILDGENLRDKQVDTGHREKVLVPGFGIIPYICTSSMSLPPTDSRMNRPEHEMFWRLKQVRSKEVIFF